MGDYFRNGNTIYFENSGWGVKVEEVEYFRILYYLTFYMKSGARIVVENQIDIVNFRRNIGLQSSLREES